LSIDMPLPALPALAAALSSPADEAQLLVGVFLVGFAFAQLIAGPLSDRFGRRPTLLVGLTLYLLCSIACAFAPTLESLLVIRLFQGISACCAPVVARAMVTDIHAGAAARRAMSIVTAGMGFAPVLAPSIGALVLEFTDWRGIFWTLAVTAGLLLAVVGFLLDESKSKETAQASLRLTSLVSRYISIGTDRRFLNYALPSLFAGGALFTFLSAATFVLQDDLHVSTRHFGLMFGFVMLGFVSGATLSGILSPRLDLDRSIVAGLAASATGGWLMFALWIWGVSHWAVIIGPMAIVMFGMGILRPNSIAGSMAPFKESAGAASALIGFLQMAAGATAGVFLFLLPYQPGDMMPVLIAIYPTISLLVFIAMRAR
ncbi:MAG: multidrug effflux MFS transporter, partial [Alphaproteobacteria bacterium]